MPFRTFLRVVATGEQGTQPRHASDETSQQPPKAPECPQCAIAMRWYQSKLERNGSESIVHSFYCTNCAQVAHVREPRAPSAEPQVA
jgi:DNA-directed RNA polymerase subunit M/transcription elongation factor TFIIS